MDKNIDKIVEHIIEVGLLDASSNYTYEKGVDKGARLMLAYLIKYGFMNEYFYKYYNLK